MKKEFTPRTGSITRRQFLYYSALAASATALPGFSATPRKLGAGDKLRIAAVGGGGKGESDIECCASEEIVAIADVDQNSAAKSLKRCPSAKFYFDWREMLDKEGKNIDAVMVSTPDHMHALVASAAIKMGKHVYCQKPLTQTVYEARHLRTLAKEHGVVTQMGNQGSSEEGLRRAVEVVQAGVIGPVRQIHVWTNRPIWPQGITRPESDPAVEEIGEVKPAGRKQTVAGIEKYLASGLIKGIGRHYARKIVAVFGERTLKVIDSAPWDQRRLPARLRALDIGAADIRRRGLAGDVGSLHRQLRLSGSRRATVVMTRVRDRPWGLVCVDVQT